MLYIASQLTYLAFAANFGSIFTVLICCLAMVLFIRQFRLHEFEPTVSSVVRVQQPVHEKFMNKISLPFSLNIGKLEVGCSGTSQLTLNSTSYFPCLFIACGDMSADVIHALINQPWRKFMETLKSDVRVWPNLHLYSEEEAHSGKNFKIESFLGDKPRSTYALVVIQTRIDDTQFEEQQPGSIVSLIHLPDQFCKSPATILCQYLKFKDGRLLNLKPLYASEEREKEQTTKDNEEQYQRNLDEGNTNCVICWTSPTTHVLLPCRHACLCLNCFKRIENCPVCRTRIVSFFLV